ncbi:MAG: hypothetical protein H6908_06570 [Hyphomicrobiales bacterium]|nr:hypothetical protein [Rickettsiales bacterium]MCP5362275.1 hypothetical protein [Hyphomicrobiales bacterium]
MDDETLKRIIRKSAHEATQETLCSLGFSIAEPQEMQADLLYLRKLRRGSEFLNLRVKASLIAFLIPTILYLLWHAIRDAIQR